jgi:LacI family transcriptional regulator
LAARGLDIRTIAKAAGVSSSTVSRVFTHSREVKAENRDRVLAVASALGWRPNSLARGLSEGSIRAVSVILSDLRNPFYVELARGIESVLYEAGYAVMLANANEDRRREAFAVQMAADHRLAGVIMAAPTPELNVVRTLAALPMPLVLLNRYPGTEKRDAVLVDDVHGGYLATRHLLNLGHQAIGYLRGPTSSPASEERLQGYYQAFAERGLRPNPNWVILGGYSEESGWSTAQRLISGDLRVSALFSATDLMTIGLVDELRRAGWQIPQDLSIVSYDDAPFHGRHAYNLTTVATPQYDMGQTAARILLSRIEGETGEPKRIPVTPTLVVRGSSGPLCETRRSLS